MIIVKLKGGLGNQLFQFAFGRALAEYRNEKLFFDLTHIVLNPQKFTDRDFKLERLKNVEIIDADSLNDFARLYNTGNAVVMGDGFPKEWIPALIYDKNVKMIMLDGYFQDEFYFLGLEEQIKKELQELVAEYGEMPVAKSLIDIYRETVSIHVRRGDYLLPEIFKLHGICGESYYQKALDLLKSELTDPYFYIFSDDAVQANEMFSPIIAAKTTISALINQDLYADKDLIELALMSQCKHFVLANSSFSWWGSYLSANPSKIVIAPEKWFQDANYKYLSDNIGLKNWIRV